MQDRFDLRTVTGSASHPSVLEEAGIDDADLLIAVTQSDEINLVACKLAARMFNVPRRVARIRANAFLDNQKILGPDGFDVDLVDLSRAGAHRLHRQAGRVPRGAAGAGFRRRPGEPGRGALATRAGRWSACRSRRSAQHIPNIDTRVVAIFRRDRAILPDGDTVIEAGDEVFCLAAADNIRQVMRELRRMDKPVKRVMIAGGGNIGLRLARALEARLFGQA